VQKEAQPFPGRVQRQRKATRDPAHDSPRERQHLQPLPERSNGIRAGTDPIAGCSFPNSCPEPGRPVVPTKLLLAAFAATALAVPACAQTSDKTPSAQVSPKDQSLSDKLQQNDGVIKPPDSGTTGTVVKPDQSGSMPVIKPQELPGRAPGTEAK
jgi:hypothetical protein